MTQNLMGLNSMHPFYPKNNNNKHSQVLMDRWEHQQALSFSAHVTSP